MQSPQPPWRPGGCCSSEKHALLAGNAFAYTLLNAPPQARPLRPDQLGLIPIGHIAERIVQRLGLHLRLIEEAGS